MKRILVIILFNITIQALYCQNDFRNLSWGTSLEDIKKLETAPLTREEKNSVGYKNGQEYFDGMNLIYENVTVGGKQADVTYKCKNGKLINIRVLFKKTLYGYDGSMSETVMSFSELYSGLSKKGYRYTSPIQCGQHVYSGPDYNNPDNEKIHIMKSWNIDKDKLDLIEKMLSEKHYQAVFFRIENERSRGSIMFLSDYSEWKNKTPVIFELNPSYDLEKQIMSSDF